MGYRTSYVFIHADTIFGLITEYLLPLASIVPYRGYKTADSDLLLGGGNDKLFGIICVKLGHPEWATDDRFRTNPLRVKNRDVLDGLIEETLQMRTTQDWLQIFEGGGVPYAAINDIAGTLNHEHGENMMDCIDVIDLSMLTFNQFSLVTW